jgi:hypothetical protein
MKGEKAPMGLELGDELVLHSLRPIGLALDSRPLDGLSRDLRESCGCFWSTIGIL